MLTNILGLLLQVKKINMTYVFFFLLTTNTYAADICKDDARMNDLANFLQTQEKIEPPLSFSVETFISLNPKFRNQLIKDIRICNKIPLNSSGKPILPLEADFFSIWEKLDISVAQNDWEEVKFLKNSFSAKPLTVAHIHSLLTYPTYNAEKTQKLAEFLGITSAVVKNKIFVADIYKSFGGKVNIPTTVAIITDLNRLPKAQITATSLEQEFKYILIGSHIVKDARKTLSALGINAVPLESYFNTNN